MMNRAAFLWRLAGLVGVGQQAGYLRNQRPEGQPCKGGDIVHQIWDGKKLNATCFKTAPDEGEELCPLGHTQKPHIRPLLVTSIGANENEPIELDDVRLASRTASVCATCGTVYVPLDAKR